MWKAYTGAGKIDAHNLYCAASGALLKEMANRGVAWLIVFIGDFLAR